MSFETRTDDADKVLKRWERANSSPDAQRRLIQDTERLWSLARDLAEALGNLHAHARTIT